ncbi:TetR/AcrR family transcriptional regulator [Azospirillum agricola]|uniref:TetR/AcrR family transcriptional regulator n=1 Tax=Azospirillum agricola TaxID=1720247 RepID=UPI001B3BFCFE|nr:TetR/AcrR family transcriptional regulator [Azospirillum agricola]
MSEHKRGLILQAARDVFEAEGLEGASLRAVATRAGYTPGALYSYFDSKEAIYAEVLRTSLAALGQAVDEAVARVEAPADRLAAAAMGFFGFYAANPRDLDLGFYLFRGGMKPLGLGRERDEELNRALNAALRPVADAAEALGASKAAADLLLVDVFAHATGLLLLLHTGRIRMFGASAPALMEAYVQLRIDTLRQSGPGRGG